MLLKNKAGCVKTIDQWHLVMEELWCNLQRDKSVAKKFPRPLDAWERFARSQQLEEVCDEKQIHV